MRWSIASSSAWRVAWISYKLSHKEQEKPDTETPELADKSTKRSPLPDLNLMGVGILSSHSAIRLSCCELGQWLCHL